MDPGCRILIWFKFVQQLCCSLCSQGDTTIISRGLCCPGTDVLVYFALNGIVELQLFQFSVVGYYIKCLFSDVHRLPRRQDRIINWFSICFYWLHRGLILTTNNRLIARFQFVDVVVMYILLLRQTSFWFPCFALVLQNTVWENVVLGLFFMFFVCFYTVSQKNRTPITFWNNSNKLCLIIIMISWENRQKVLSIVVCFYGLTIFHKTRYQLSRICLLYTSDAADE